MKYSSIFLGFFFL